MTAQPVLNLDGELRQIEITYKGDTYELRSRGELSILELHEFSGLLHQYDDLTDIQDGDAESAAKVGEALQKIAATLVKDPPEGGFPDQLCAAILSFWTEQHRDGDGPPPPRPRRAPQDRKPKQKKRTSTGAK